MLINEEEKEPTDIIVPHLYFSITDSNISFLLIILIPLSEDSIYLTKISSLIDGCDL